MSNDYKKSIQNQIRIKQHDLEANKIPPVTQANIKRQQQIQTEIENLKKNLKK